MYKVIVDILYSQLGEFLQSANLPELKRNFASCFKLDSPLHQFLTKTHHFSLGCLRPVGSNDQ